MRLSGRGKVFLFLQGPHGPFFYRLGQMLRAAEAEVWRVGFNFGDRMFWPDRGSFLPYRGTIEDWPARLAEILAEKQVTDLVLYGDTRAIHAKAVAIAQARGLTVHVYEEGYLRPYWVSYERGGSNGHSRLMQTSIAEMRQALGPETIDLPDAPARWGDMRQHMFWGALYHWCVMICFWDFKSFRPHRKLTVVQEFRLYLRKLAFLPLHALERRLATRAIARGGFPYHLVLLQLEHDASFRDHSRFETMGDFIAEVMEAFAKGAPPHHHLVFKAHPLEDGRVPMRNLIRAAAKAHGVAKRVHFVRGGKLAGLLNAARAVVTVNSTAAQQALWRNLPLKAFGSAVYDKPELVSQQAPAAFFAEPERPDPHAYRAYRHYLLETSQVAGGFYSRKGRQTLLREVTDLMLAPQDPYQMLESGKAAPRQQLRIVS